MNNAVRKGNKGNKRDKNGWRTVSIKEDRLEKLKEIFDTDNKKPKNQYFNAWLDNLLLNMVEHQERIRKYGPFLEFLNMKNIEEIILSDYKLDKIIHIFIKKEKKELHCDYCKKNNCVHIGFCYNVPEVYNKLVESSFKTDLSHF